MTQMMFMKARVFASMMLLLLLLLSVWQLSTEAAPHRGLLAPTLTSENASYIHLGVTDLDA